MRRRRALTQRAAGLPICGCRRRLVDPVEAESVCDAVEQCAHVERLHHDARRGRRPRAAPAGVSPTLAESIRIGAGMAALAQRLRQVPAVHAGHGDVEQEEVGLDVGGQRQAPAPSGGGEHDEAERLEDLAHQIALVGIVVDDQDGAARARHSR